MDAVGPLRDPGGARGGRRRDDAAAVHGPFQRQREAGDHHALARGQHAVLLLHACRYAHSLIVRFRVGYQVIQHQGWVDLKVWTKKFG